MITFDKVLLGFANINIVPLNDSIYVRVLLLFECINVINTCVYLCRTTSRGMHPSVSTPSYGMM